MTSLEQGICFGCGQSGECVRLATHKETLGAFVMLTCRACAEKSLSMFPLEEEKVLGDDDHAEVRILKISGNGPEYFSAQYRLKGHYWETFSEVTGEDYYFPSLVDCRVFLNSKRDDPGEGITVLDPFDETDVDADATTCTMHFDPGPECLDKILEDVAGEKCAQCGRHLLFSARATGDGYCHPCGHKALAKQKVAHEVLVLELRDAIRFALEKCVKRTAGNLDNPFAYLWQQDWDDFAALALKAGVFVMKEDDG